ncbi:MAG TPA: amino acid ABC transporter substrate-binding protein [Candidatus Nitrosocosmicus sp.]|jgi:branched-chain amino acid transport system substrate-binding protein|nr:amino acid ABC transporter substrate-binding protein [Candidatus Nitrosocosmicus sp.]
MTMSSWKSITAAAVVAAVTAVALPAAAQAPVKIGASISMTGTYAKPGIYQKEGYELCVQEANDKGGLLGRKIDLVVYDDQSTPATGQRLYEKLITEDKVDVVMGPYSSAISEAVANVTEKYKKVMVAPLAATTSIFKKGRKYIFMVISPAEVYLEGLVDIAAKRGLKTIAIVNEDTLFPKTAANGTAEFAKKRGLQIVLQEAYPKGNTDFSALLTKIKAANPDVIAASTYFDDAVALTRQMKELNVTPKMYGVTVGGDLPEFYDLLKQNAEYIYGATQWEPTLPYPGQKEFMASYQKKFNHEPSYHAAAGYAGCVLYLDAVKKAGTLDADKVREQLLKLETRTMLGDYKVDADGFQTAHKMVLFQWQDGKKVTVWPDDLAAGGKARFPTPPWNQR